MWQNLSCKDTQQQQQQVVGLFMLHFYMVLLLKSHRNSDLSLIRLVYHEGSGVKGMECDTFLELVR